MISVVDVSAPINFAGFAAVGGKAVMIKCSEGVSFVSPSFAGSKAAALTAGLAVGTYHFMHAGNADRQALWYLQQLNPAQGERVVCDAEFYNGSGPSLADIRLFVQTILAKRPDLRVTIYANVDFLTQRFGAAKDEYLAKVTDLWIAQWNVAKPTIPTATWATWALWQVTGTQRAYGGQIDTDAFNGDDKGLVEWVGPAKGPPINDFSSVIGVQRGLIAAGYELTPDGQWGPQTGAALTSATRNGKDFRPPGGLVEEVG